ncbi:MAG: 2Fe-2S iron-sulfur cluster-binding protein [Planctomycetaceae bacterium]|nr:2Fe-2S iron-sulfur cluster-binding protein [Planctomycetaceae bacterium]
MKITIDNQLIPFTSRQTILDAARSAGIDIPVLCFRERNNCRITPASCQVCLVKLDGKRFVPSCASKAEDGMVVESETDEVKQLRKTALELLLSEHYGDCAAPCQLACPAGLDIPKVLRAIQRNDFTEALEIIKQFASSVDCANCRKPCETVCRRNGLDSAVSISRLISELMLRDVSSSQSTLQATPQAAVKMKWSVKRNKPSKETLQTLENTASKLREAEGITETDCEIVKQANRCLHCDCLGKDKCSLLRYCTLYNASPRRFSQQPATVPPIISGKIVFEMEKCIRCGVCIAVAEKNGEETGLSFIGRGYDVKVGVPFAHPLDAALQNSAEEAAAMCPTGALNVIKSTTPQ